MFADAHPAVSPAHITTHVSTRDCTLRRTNPHQPHFHSINDYILELASGFCDPVKPGPRLCQRWTIPLSALRRPKLPKTVSLGFDGDSLAGRRGQPDPAHVQYSIPYAISHLSGSPWDKTHTPTQLPPTFPTQGRQPSCQSWALPTAQPLENTPVYRTFP